MLKASKPSYTPAIEAGGYMAVLVQVIDLGTHVEQFEDQDPSEKHKIDLVFELSDELDSEGQPARVSARYTFSTHPNAKLRKHLNNWVGLSDEDASAFAPSSLLGKAAVVSVNDKGYVSSVGPLVKGQSGKAPVGALEELSLDEDFDQELFDRLPAYIQKFIKESPEYQKIAATPF